MFNPLRFFLTIGSIISAIGFLIGCRFVFYYLLGQGTGKMQSLILAAALLMIGFQTIVVGLLSDLIAANRRLIEDILFRVRKIESKE